MLKFLIITICILWIVKVLVRWILPYLLQRVVNRAQDQARHQQQYQQKYRREGSKASPRVHIDYIPPKDKEARAADRAGDFIDFEEIK